MKGNTHVVIILLILFSPVLYDITVLIRKVRIGEVSKQKLKRRLLRISIIAGIITSVIITLNHTNYLNYRSPIPFSKVDQISFKDFRGLEFFRKRLNGSKRFAYVVTSIEYNINSNHVYLQSYFHPSRSYVFNKNSYSKELLRHEIYHFRITELFARKMRKDISKLKHFDKNAIERIVQKHKSDEQKYQLSYDADTYHSYVLKQQKKYENEIDSLISSLDEYYHPIIRSNVE